ncbi:MAG: hypothetical protein DRP51_03990 [Candidatus Zixiibacteriota bacterium]|nr:MAG: hypothetical protein DRP51_03990 [candidate division Zixibacteria bacterium]
MSESLITSPLGVLAILAGVASFFFFLEKKTSWKIFNFFPPLIFIYTLPVVFSNTGLIVNESPVYDFMGDTVLPMFLIIMLLDVDVRSAVKVMGKGIFVMLFGTAGVIIGAPIAFWLVKNGLGPEAWKGFGALAGSWIGGTGNMAAVSEGLKTPGEAFGLAVIADNVVYLIWLPLLLSSKNISKWFSKFARVDKNRIEMLAKTSGELNKDKDKLEMRHLLYLFFFGLFFAWLAGKLAGYLPAVPPVLTAGTWKILLVTTFGIILSMTKARNIPGSHQLAMALIYLFVANMGARANINNLADQAPWFILGAYIWIFIHGAFCILGARLFRVDIHSTAIASAANIGGAASAPVVAAFHNEKLVPVSILMALIGYAVGNYGAFAAAWLCFLVS